jgi:anti-anti-sigma factor
MPLGEIDVAQAPCFAGLLAEVIEAPGTSLVLVDMAAVTMIDSAGIGTLVASYDRAQAFGVAFALGNCTTSVQRELEVAGLLAALTGQDPTPPPKP